MKRIIGISILLVTITLMSFAGEFGPNQRGVLAGEAQEIVGLEREYQFFSMLNELGLTQDQLNQIIGAAQKAKESLLSIETEVKADLERAIELVKAGEVEKARQKHEEAMVSGQEVLAVRETYMDALKAIITVEQQEVFMKHMSTTMKKGMSRMKEAVVDNERFKQLPETVKEKWEQMGKNVGNPREQREIRENAPVRSQPNLRGMVNQTLFTNFFNRLLIDDNLDLMKDYLNSMTGQNSTE